MNIYDCVSKNKENLKCLYLPVTIDCNISMETEIKNKLNNYVDLLKQFQLKLGFDENQISRIKNLVEGICEVVTEIENIKFDNAYEKMKTLLNSAFEILEINKNDIPNEFVTQLQENTTLYRSRKGKFFKEEDFYHVPSVMNSKCKSYRFSELGYPAFYLSHTVDGSKVEFKNGDEISTAAFKYRGHENLPIRILDLTLLGASKRSSNCQIGVGNYKMHYIWPIIATCYCISYWCKYTEKECGEIERDYKQEYVFPQMISRYLRENCPEINGIKYFTVRNFDLNSEEEKMAQYALFTKYYDNKGIDDSLINHFEIEIIKNCD